MATLPELLKQAVEMQASDLHLSIGSPPQCRVHGELEKMAPHADLSPTDTKSLTYAVLTDAQKKRFEETKELDFSFGIRGLARFRCNMFNQKGAVGAVYRQIPERIRPFDELGLPAVLSKMAERPRGLVLVTGPTGSGKSTTLAAMIDKINTERHGHILTVEDPIEYHLGAANQVQVHAKIGMTFAAALRALLRQDPDVVMLGEIRDGETATIAVQAALTGHLVLSTLHTNDAPSSVTRLINIGVEPYLISAALNAILAQRLVRKICQKCKMEYEPTPEIKEFLHMQGYGAEKTFKGAGCEKCRKTGYSGRLGIFELLVMDDGLRDMVTANPDVNQLRKLCRERGLVTLRQDGFEKVKKGLTTIDEIIRVTENG